MTRADIIKAMQECEQAPGQTVYQHCRAVYSWYLALRDFQLGDPPPDCPGARIPAWVLDPLIVNGQLPEPVVHEYLLMHDCGKPFCLEIDAEGRRHFPNHAKKSAEIWRAVRRKEIVAELRAMYPDDLHAQVRTLADMDFTEYAQTARLIELDMEAHCLTSERIPEFAALPEAPTLLLAAVAEVHANAAMFGGFDSAGFKIKAKHLDRRGRQVLAHMRAQSA